MSDFPFFNTKKLSDGNKYNISDPVERRAYFAAKLGTKIDDLKRYLDANTFVGFLLAKKGAGKGTFAKMFQEIVGVDRVAHISVGDLVRDVHATIGDTSKKVELLQLFEKNYRGSLSLDDALAAFVGKSQDKLIPTEFILTLVKLEVEKLGRKAVFIDGFPRNLDQISYSLYFRDLVNFREDPDFFLILDTPAEVINERMKHRVICPICHTSRSIKLNPTRFVKYDESSDSFYLVCDNSACVGFGKRRLVGKEGDELGIEAIRDRLEMDASVIQQVSLLHGIPKILVRNAVPVDKVAEVVEEYEVTPAYSYKQTSDGAVEVLENPWTFVDYAGVESCSLLPAVTAIAAVSGIHSLLFDD
jgi:adenylate kinase family enzyme